MKAISTSTKKPIFKVQVNGVEFTPSHCTDIDLSTQKIDFQTEHDEISTIDISLLNKEANDTKVVNGNITEDLLIIVDQLRINQINLIDKLSKISVYKDQQGNVHRTHTYITFNGTMTIKLHKNLLYTHWLASLI